MRERKVFMRHGFRLGVVEDDPDDRLFLEIALARAGLKLPIQFFTDGVEAIEYLEESRLRSDQTDHPFPTMLLLDLKLPRRDGFEVLRWIKSQPGLRRMVVVVFTSSDLPKDVNLAYELGANSYLVKNNFEDLPRLLMEIDHYWRRTNQFPDYEMAG
jgi:CheY-like chemotaxis protein